MPDLAAAPATFGSLGTGLGGLDLGLCRAGWGARWIAERHPGRRRASIRLLRCEGGWPDALDAVSGGAQVGLLVASLGSHQFEDTSDGVQRALWTYMDRWAPPLVLIETSGALYNLHPKLADQVELGFTRYGYEAPVRLVGYDAVREVQWAWQRAYLLGCRARSPWARTEAWRGARATLEWREMYLRESGPEDEQPFYGPLGHPRGQASEAAVRRMEGVYGFPEGHTTDVGPLTERVAALRDASSVPVGAALGLCLLRVWEEGVREAAG